VEASGVTDGQFDGVVVVGDAKAALTGPLQSLSGPVKAYLELDKAASSSEVAVIVCPDVPSKRVFFAPTGPLNRDYDDIRRFQDAAEKGIKRALAAGCKAPVLVCANHAKYALAPRVALLGALHGLYTPIEVREAVAAKARKVDKLGVLVEGAVKSEIEILKAIESARTVYRDIGGSDPERMAAPRVAEYVENTFKDTCVKVTVISDITKLSAEYPLLAAVNRAAINVPRHTARLIFLEYVGEGTIDTTLMLVGKGITYDTGGADLKVGGHMAGMHRDKCGAACVAGFFQLLSVYKPKGLKVIGSMSMVRNSIGSECYVSDEIITSRAGVRIRIGNTDAEGRMVMADLLCHMKEKSAAEINPLLFTIATLTGHVIRAFGPEYTGIMENGPAKQFGIAKKLQEAGDISGDPFEISTIRREDYLAHTLTLVDLPSS
jgi:leucyl aminopeptidase